MRVTCDSDVLSHFGRGAGRGAKEIHEALSRELLCLNAICLFEVRGGMEDMAKVQEFDRAFSHLTVLEFTREAAIKAGDLWRELRRRKQTLAIRDLFLAAIASTHRMKLLTADHDFKPLKELGLDIEIITSPSRVPD